MERPLCKCHGLPMNRNGRDSRRNGRQQWNCQVVRRKETRKRYWERGGRERLAAQYRERVDAGVCVKCEGPLTTSVLCWDCLNKQEARHALSL